MNGNDDKAQSAEWCWHDEPPLRAWAAPDSQVSGCPLRRRETSNLESASLPQKLVYTSERCTLIMNG